MRIGPLGQSDAGGQGPHADHTMRWRRLLAGGYAYMIQLPSPALEGTGAIQDPSLLAVNEYWISTWDTCSGTTLIQIRNGTFYMCMHFACTYTSA